MRRTAQGMRANLALCVLSFTGYWLWVFLALLDSAVYQRPSTSVFEDPWLWSTMSHIGTLLMFAALSRFYAPFGRWTSIIIASPLLSVAGLCLLLFADASTNARLATAIFGSLLTGIGNAGMIICWGEAYSRLRAADRLQLVIPVAIVLYILCYLGISLLPEAAVHGIAIVLPILTMACVWLMLKRMGEGAGAVGVAGVAGRTGVGAVGTAGAGAVGVTDAGVGAAGAAGVGVAGVAGVAGVGAAGTADAGDASTGVADAAKRSFSPYLGLFCLFYSIPLGYFKLSFFSGSEEGATWPLIMLTSLALIVLVTAIETLVRARNKPAFIFRVIVPVAIAGLLLLAILKGSDVVLPGILVYSAQLFLTIFCYNTFMSLAQGGERWAPAWFFAIGISFTDGGFVLGMLTSEVSSSLDSSQMLGLTLGVVYVVTLAGFLLLPRINETIVSHRKTQANGTAIAEEDTGLPMTSVRGSLYDVTLAFSESCQLTAREGEMLGCLLRGLSVPAIARETFLSKNTVRTHIAHIYQKAGVHSRDELIMRIEELEELG